METSYEQQRYQWVGRQEQFYASRPHAHLRYSPSSVYAANLVDRAVRAVQPTSRCRILEVGCGSGRFSLHMVRRTEASLVAFDLSNHLLEELQRQLESLPAMVQARCRVEAGDVYRLDSLRNEPPFDIVLGFFFLHHLPDIAEALRQLRRVLRPGGRMLFVEPNRRNPLFLLQILCSSDMSWAVERGMYTLGRARLRKAFLAAGMSMPYIETFGCFPPQILDRWPRMLHVEQRIERSRICQAMLPFRLITSRRLESGET